MDFSRSSGRKKKTAKSNVLVKQSELYQHALQMYRVPPIDEITLSEFNELALERLKLLRIVEQTTLKFGNKNIQAREHFITELRKNQLMHYGKKTSGEDVTAEEYEERRRDHISHFLLRLSYCRTEVLRRWFMQQECDLFKFRFLGQAEMIPTFLEANNMDCEPISKREKKAILDKLVCSGFRLTEDNVMGQPYYKVPFTEVLELVANRRVYLKQGYAYIPNNDFVSIVLNIFRTNLSKALTTTARHLPQVEDDTRLKEILSLDRIYLGHNYSIVKNTGEVTSNALDDLCKSSFPLCMRILHENMRHKHHLKHFGRQQYGLFLKGIGMSMEETMRFFREEFTRNMDLDQFEKKYPYGIRHNYGKEGKRANYTPYSCKKIILSNPPGPGDSHGCPFRHADADNLRQKLKSVQIPPSGIREILDLVSKGHYQLACTHYFELTHKGATVDQAIEHPNQYFTESKKVHDGDGQSTTHVSKPVTTRSQMFPSQSTAATPPSTQDAEMDDIGDEESMLMASAAY